MAGHWVALVGRLGALLLLCMGLIAGTAPLRASPELPPLPPATASAATGQEITLGALGLTTQAATGAVSSLESAFPPPAGPLAGSGSFARICFSHSPLLDPASALTVLINGQPLTSVSLTSATAAGSASRCGCQRNGCEPTAATAWRPASKCPPRPGGTRR